MPPPTQHVAVTPLGPVAAATVTWLLRGQLYVTVVVKATFALVPEGRMSLVKPEPVALDEQPDPSGRALRTAGDLAPYLGQCDVVVTGHAELPPGFSSPEVVVRLAVVQGGQVCIDKQALLDGSARVGAARSHVRIDGMGPLGRGSPQRSRLLGGGDARRLAGLRLDIPEGLDGSYFQAAPVDQRLRTLRGDEWIVLGGMVAQRPKLRTQLPEACGAARLYRRQRAAPRAGEPIPLRADTVHVDVDRRCCSVVWRGHAPVDEAELASLRVLAGVELPAQPLAWTDPFAAERAPSVRPGPAAPASLQGPRGGALEGTSHLSVEEAARVAAAAVTPFDPWRAPAGAARPSSAPPAATGAQRSERPAARSRDSARSAEVALAAEADPSGGAALLGETSALSPEDEAKVLSSAATPFNAARAPAEPARPAAPAVSRAPAEPARPTAPATSRPAAASSAAAAPLARRGGVGELLGETSALTPEEAARVVASAATPFDARRAPGEVAPAIAHPPAMIAHPPAMVDASAPPEGLGAQFLAAMADVDPPAG
ncbi:DUF2169 domain-containing protein [Sorangium sp. So ce118]